MTDAPRTRMKKKICQESLEGDNRKDTRRRSVIAFFSPLPNSKQRAKYQPRHKVVKKNYLGNRKRLTNRGSVRKKPEMLIAIRF